ALYAVLAFYATGIEWTLLKSAYLMFIEFCIIISICLVFSSYSSSFMSSLFAFSFFVIGHLSDNFAKVILKIAKDAKIEAAWPQTIADIVQIFNLDMFVIHTQIVHGITVPNTYLLKATLFGLGWITVFLTLSMILFRKKDLK